MSDFIIENGTLIQYTGPGGDVVVPEGITAIREQAFYQCDTLHSITLPKGLTSIGSQAFFCTQLEQVTLPDSLTFIGEYAFAACSRMRSITIPEKVTTIDYYAFRHCDLLDTVILLGAVTELAYDVFDRRLDLALAAPNTSLELLKDHELLSAAVLGFLLHPQLYTDPTTVTQYQKLIATEKNHLLPVLLEKDLVQGIEQYCEAGLVTAKNIDSSFLQPAIHANASQCVSYLMNWKHRHISSEDLEDQLMQELLKDPYNIADMEELWSYRQQEDGTFVILGYKGNDTEITLPERIGQVPVTALGDDVFNAFNVRKLPHPYRILTGITSITIPEGIRTIGHRCFQGCCNLQSVSIPNTVTAIGERAFRGCTQLTSIHLPDSITSLGDQAFGTCRRLQSITLSKGLRRIGKWTFQYCESLQSIILPDRITTIGHSAFEKCASLQTITLPKTLTEIGFGAFTCCFSLLTLQVPEGVTTIGNSAFYNCRSLTYMNIPASVTCIGSGAFMECKKLTLHVPAGSYAQSYLRNTTLFYTVD